MEHVVFYPGAEGVPSFERVSSLDAAVSYIEQLRNVENITEFSVHALTPVPVSFRAYYHVEVPSSDEQIPDGQVPLAADAMAPVARVALELPLPSRSDDAASADAAVTPELAPLAAEPAEFSTVEPSAEVSAEVSDEVSDAVNAEPAAEVSAEVGADADVESASEPDAPLDVAPAPAEAPASESVDEAATDEVTMVPVEASDEDRSAQWVAEASVLEPPLAAAPDEATSSEAPAAEAPEAADVDNAAELPAMPLSPSMTQTPFAVAPPVSSAPMPEPPLPMQTVPMQAEASVEEPAAAAEEDAEAIPPMEPATADVIPVPSGRRSMGFFAR